MKKEAGDGGGRWERRGWRRRRGPLLCKRSTPLHSKQHLLHPLWKLIVAVAETLEGKREKGAYDRVSGNWESEPQFNFNLFGTWLTI